LSEHKLKATQANPPQSTDAIDQAISAVQQMMAEDPEVLFLVGYYFLPAHGPSVLETLRPSFAGDAAHMKLPGDTATVFGIWGQDANKHLINLGLMVAYDTENTRSWTQFLAAVKTHYPAMDTDDMIIIADGDKGFKRAFTETFDHGNRFMCAHHKSGNLRQQKGVTKDDVGLYWKAVKAATMPLTKLFVSRMTNAAQAYLAKTPESELYLAYVGGKTGGKTSSQLAETGNATLAEMRYQQLVEGLMTFQQNEFTRLTKIGQRAKDYSPDELLPPAHRQELKKMQDENTAKGWDFTVTISEGDGVCAVTSKKDPSKKFYLELCQPGSCSCGESASKAMPCIHEVLAARCAGKDPALMYPPQATAAAWKATYAAMVRPPAPPSPPSPLGCLYSRPRVSISPSQCFTYPLHMMCTLAPFAICQGDLRYIATNLVHEQPVDEKLPLMPIHTRMQKGRPKGPVGRAKPASELHREANALRARTASARRISRSAAQEATMTSGS